MALIRNHALATAIRESGLKKGFVCEKVGVGPWKMTQWLKGDVIADEHLAKLADLLDRPAGDFVLPEHVTDPSQPDMEKAA